MTDGLVSLEHARRTRAKASRSAKAPRRADDDSRPVIRLKVGELERVVDEVERALIAADRGVYQRANLLVAVGSAPIITSDRRKVLARQILPIGEHRLLELVTSAICFEKWDSRAGDFVPANPPMMLVRTLEDRRGRFRFPPLSGLVNAPTMRADGSLLTVPGYDAATGLLFDPGDDAFPPIPARPSRSDAVEALRLIKGLLDGFPFIGAPDRSVALAAILTATVRRSLPTAPMFGFTAPTPGSGKTKLADIASIIATGREAGVISQGRTDEETEKRIGALLLGGAAIAIDNVEQPVGGDLLCQLLTQQTVRLRVLGKSDVPEMPTNVSVTVTGNNLTILGDLARRTLICRLDPGVERPELREFDFDPRRASKGGSRCIPCGGPDRSSCLHHLGSPEPTVAARLL